MHYCVTKFDKTQFSFCTFSFVKIVRFNPASFLTAVKQLTCQSKKLALDKLMVRFQYDYLLKRNNFQQTKFEDIHFKNYLFYRS